MLFDKFQTMADFQAELAERDVKPFGAVTEEILSATEGVVQGRKVILAGTNNYLGLSFDPRCIKAAQDAAARWGTGTTGSRLANGSFAEHQALEDGNSRVLRRRPRHCLLHRLCRHHGHVLHAGRARGCHSAGRRQPRQHLLRRQTQRRRDYSLQAQRPGRPRQAPAPPGDRAGQALIIAEGIYSMLGDVAPLQEIAAVKREYGGYLFLDEAHSMGVLGETGRGAAQAAGVEADVDFFAGTFSKSLGAIGGFCVSRHAELEAIRYCINAYIFTASSSPSIIASTREALRIIAQSHSCATSCGTMPTGCTTGSSPWACPWALLPAR